MSLRDMIKSANAGARSASFSDIGDVVGGEVTDVSVFQDKDDDGELKYWGDGNPVMKCRIIVQTSLDDGPDDQGRADDGRRAIYIKLWGDQFRRLREALTKVEAEDVEVGGKFYGKYAGDLPKPAGAKKQWSAPKDMRYKYVPAPKIPRSAPADEFGDDEGEEEPPSKPAQTRRPAAAAARKPAAKPTRGRGAQKVDLEDTADPVDGTGDALAEAGLGDDDF